MIWTILSVIVFVTSCTIVRADIFPSLLSANATIGIVLDRDYLGDDYQVVRDAIEKYFIFAKREILLHGGIKVQYYSWTKINVKRDFTAILSVASCADTWKIYRAAIDENILFMSISESDCPRLPHELAITVPLLQNGEEFPQLLLDLRSAKAYNWLSTIILYDTTLDRDMITRVVTSLTGHSDTNAGVTSAATTLSVMKLENQTQEFKQRKVVTEILSKLPTKQLGMNFLIIVTFNYVNAIMEVAKNLGLMNPYSQWLYIISDTSNIKGDINGFSNLIGEGDNIAFIYNTTTKGSECTRGIQCHCEELLEAFTKSLENAILEEISVSNQVSEEEWEAIRPTKAERRNYLLQGIKAHLTTSGACSNCTKWQMKAGDTWGRSYIQNQSQLVQEQLISVGSWRPSDGVSFTDELFPHVKHKFRGRNLPFITYNNPPWQILITNNTGHIIGQKGLVFDIIEELSHRLNFTYTLHISKHDSTSYESNVTSQEEYTRIELINIIPEDIIETVAMKKAFLGACAFTINPQMKKFINFTIPITIQSHTFMVARPMELSRVLLFIRPFTYDTWLCLAAAVVVMSPLLYIINKYSPVYAYRRTEIKGLTKISSCFWYMYGALLQQGGMYLPEVDSARLIVGTWWLVVLVVVTTYCGNLVAFLTFPKIDIPIRTINDLIKNRDTVSWGIIRNTYLDEYLQDAEEPRYQTLYSGVILHDEITPEIIAEVQDRTHVFIGWKTKIAFIMKKNFLETGQCEFAFGEDDFIDEKIGMIVALDNPYLPLIDEEILRLHQVGLIEKWLKDYMPKRDKCWKVGHVTEVNNHTVNIDDMQGCFFVLFLGYSIAVLIILLEKFLYRRNLKKIKTVITPFVT